MRKQECLSREKHPQNFISIKISGIYSRPPYTEYISTRWYRAPECLLTDGFYSYKMDLFAAGCVWFEVMALFPLFPGQNEMDQVHKFLSLLEYMGVYTIYFLSRWASTMIIFLDSLIAEPRIIHSGCILQKKIFSPSSKKSTAFSGLQVKRRCGSLS